MTNPISGSDHDRTVFFLLSHYLGKFNQIFANDAIAHAIVDRLVNVAEIFYLEGVSYREHQRKTRGKTNK